MLHKVRENIFEMKEMIQILKRDGKQKKEPTESYWTEKYKYLKGEKFTRWTHCEDGDDKVQ